MTDEERKQELRAERGLVQFIGTMLEDAQYQEAEEAFSEERGERDTGTIYTLTLSTYLQMRNVWQEFRAEAGPMLAKVRGTYGLEEAGNDLWLHWAGHGTGFADRKPLQVPAGLDDDGTVAEALERIADKATGGRTLTPYLGDDGQVYLG